MTTIERELIDVEIDPQTVASKRPSTRTVCILAAGVALAISVGAHGPAPWPALRAVIALAASAAVLESVRRGGRIGSCAMVVLGLAAAVVGAGTGPAYVVETGLSVSSIAGIAALLSGLTLAGAGTVALTRRARGWRRLLVVPIVPAVLMLLALPLFVAVLVTNAPPFKLGDALPSDIGLAYEDVEVRTTDGVRLLGWYVPSSNGAAVVLRAGAGSDRTDVLDHAAVLARGGYGVLLLEARGHGGSGGNANRWGWYGDRDISAGVTFLQSRHDVVDDRIGVVGISMGGEEAIGAAGSDERIRAVVAEGTTGRGIATEGAPSNKATGWIGRTMAWIGEQATALMTSAPIPTKLRDAAEASAPRPMLIIIAGDVAEERDAGAHFQAAAPNSVDLWIVPDTGHTNGIKTHPDEWADRVLQFLDRSL